MFFVSISVYAIHFNRSVLRTIASIQLISDAGYLLTTIPLLVYIAQERSLDFGEWFTLITPVAGGSFRLDLIRRLSKCKVSTAKAR